jgi:DNA repair protein RadC
VRAKAAKATIASQRGQQENRVALRDWPRSERPRERLMEVGPQSLSDGELLAILLGTGVRGASATDLARRLLEQLGGLAGVLGNGAAELAQAPGVGPARAARLAAALELGRRYLSARGDPRPALAAPLDAARYLSARLLDLPHEVFCCLFLDLCGAAVYVEDSPDPADIG